MFQASGYMPPSVFIDVSCGTLSAMYIDGAFSDLLLRQAYIDETVH